MRDRYFAYGSNLELARMTRRVPSARALGAAVLEGHALRVDKCGSDGSAKANISPAPGSRVWGVLYEIEVAEWPCLDACEDGYERIAVQVALGRGRVGAQTYRSDLLTPDPTALAWYKQLMLDGARHHGLPEEWIALLEALPAR